jgi:O-methyltransferase involved in polyketide biosynthesis
VARNPAAQTAFGPMVLVAVEQCETPGRRLVDDDLAAQFLPAPTSWLVTATPPNLMRRLTMAAMEREGPGLWAGMTCRKRYIADKVTESLDDIDIEAMGIEDVNGADFRSR